MAVMSQNNVLLSNCAESWFSDMLSVCVLFFYCFYPILQSDSMQGVYQQSDIDSECSCNENLTVTLKRHFMPCNSAAAHTFDRLLVALSASGWRIFHDCFEHGIFSCNVPAFLASAINLSPCWNKSEHQAYRTRYLFTVMMFEICTILIIGVLICIILIFKKNSSIY